MTDVPRGAIELPLMLFLRLADGDGKMTAHEMERFDRLLAERSWCRSALLRVALASTEAEKPALWKLYVAGGLRTDIEHVAATLDTLLGAVAAPERAAIEADLLYFCRELLKAAPRGGLALRRDAQTRETFAALRALILRPSARAAQTAPMTEADAAEASVDTRRGGGAALLTAEVSVDMVWQRGRLLLRCVQVVDETHDVRSFRLAAEPARYFRYLPGQFVTLEIPRDGTTMRRSYTVAETPSRPYLLAITVKRVEGGQASNWLHDNLRVGDTLFADGPFGKFTCIGDDGGPYLFLSGGSGITPVMAMARWLHDTRPDADVLFVHFARGPEDFIFADELRLIARRLPSFRLELICSRAGAGSGWTGRTGRISAALLRELAPDLARRGVYLCGPVAFMETARAVLGELAFDMTRFRQESFGGVPRDAAATAPGAPAKVIFAASNLTVDCTDSDIVLDLALAQALPVAFSCRAGQCGTCKVTLLSGRVEQDATDALSDEERRSGVILACQARPVGEVTIDL